MIRKSLLAGLAILAACAETPEPVPHADGDIVTRAVRHAQAQIEPDRERELRP